MGRKLRSTIPQSDKHLNPEWPYFEKFINPAIKVFKGKQQYNVNRRHRVCELAPIPEETDVWVTTENPPIEGQVIGPAGPPRSYVVETPTGQIHRNRQLNVIPEPESSQEQQMTSMELHW